MTTKLLIFITCFLIGYGVHQYWPKKNIDFDGLAGQKAW
jgi:cbb3-type cytochrome oxidase subunit 3